MARFKKGQKVYYASTNFAELNDYGKRNTISFAAIIERTIDSCGAKQMTFADFGNDSVFGRSARADAPVYFATPEEALEFLKSEIERRARPGWQLEILDGVYSDQDKSAFKRFREIQKERGYDERGRKY